MALILVVDDEPAIRNLLRLSLQSSQWEVRLAATAFEGVQEFHALHPDLVLLDLNLPDGEGTTVLADVRASGSTPVIVLSVRNQERDIVALLEAGADDYLTKPFSLAELQARMLAVLKRSRPTPGEAAVRLGDLVLDLDRRTVTLAGQTVHLTPTEYAILALLARNQGRIVTHSQLVRSLWGPHMEGDTGSLRVHIASLRRKLELDPAHPAYLSTEIGVGYRLAAPQPDQAPSHPSPAAPAPRHRPRLPPR